MAEISERGSSRRHSVPSEEVQAQAEDVKKIGNDLFKAGHYKEALECYNQAIFLFPRNPRYYNNRAACFMQISMFDQCITDACMVLSLDENNMKALMRRAMAYEASEKLQEALKDYQTILRLDPSIQAALEGRGRMQRLVRQARSEGLLLLKSEEEIQAAEREQVRVAEQYADQESESSDTRQQQGSLGGEVRGLLYKRGGGTRFVVGRKSWKPRYFVLKGYVLMYYKTEEEYKSGNDPLKNQNICITGHDIEINTKFREFGIEISNPADESERVWQLACSTEEEQKRWFTALQHASGF